MRIKMLWVLTVTTMAMTTMAVAAVRVDEIPKYDASKYSQKVTGCDLLAGHPKDPYKVVVGLEKMDMDLPGAIGACRAAVARDPTNPRLNYQLARVYGYSGMGEKAYPYRDTALAAGYPQSVMVYGLLHMTGQNKARKDKCLAGELLHRSALLYGRGQINFVLWSLRGEFAGCSVKQDPKEMLEFLEAADQHASNYLQKTVIEMAREQVKALMEGKR